MHEIELIRILDSLPTAGKYEFIINTLKDYPTYLRFKNRLARHYLAEGNVNEAREIIEKQLDKKHNLPLHFTLVELEIQCDNLAAANKQLDYIIEKYPSNPHSQMLKAKIEIESGSIDSAIKCYEKAIALDNSSKIAIKSLFDIHVKNKAYRKAELLIDSALSKIPNEFRFLIAKASLLMHEQDRNNEAMASLNLAIQAAKNNVQAIRAIIALSKTQEKDISIYKVIENLEEYIKQFPKEIKLKIRLTQLLIKAKKINRSLLTIEDVLYHQPNNQRAKLLKATILQKQNQFEEAKNICHSILERNPTSFQALLIIAQIWNAKGQEELAFKTFQKIQKYHPDNHLPYHHMSQLVFKAGDIQAALSILDQGIKIVSSTIFLCKKKIQLLLHVGRYLEALDLIQKHSKVYDPDLSYFKAQIYQRQGKFTEVKIIIEELKRSTKNNQSWIDKADQFLSATAFLEYDYTTAKSILDRIVESTSDSNMMRNRLSLLYLLEGNIEGAINQLKSATCEIEKSEKVGKFLIPLIGHTSRVINEFRIDPELQKEALASFELKGQDRINFLAKRVLAHPNYFGFSLYLNNELRSQLFFNKLSSSLEVHKSNVAIPKTIIQYWDSPEIPKNVISIMSSWKKLNLGYEHKVYSRQSAYVFIKIHLGEKEAKAFLNCEHPAMQADFFRLAYLSKRGGFYADADDKCIRPLDDVASCGAELIVKLGDFGCISNNFLACVPENPIINSAFTLGVKNMLSYFHEGPWFKLGPGHVTKCFTHYLADFVEETDLVKWPRIKVLDQFETRKFLSQHLSLPYKSSDQSWFTAEYKREISRRKVG